MIELPKELIEIKARQIWEKRQLDGIDGTAQSDWGEAKRSLEEYFKTTIDSNTQVNNLAKLKIRLNFWKFVISLFFGTVLGGFLTWYINYKEVQIKEKESIYQLQLNERKELEKYFQYTLEGDIYDRLQLSMFFKGVLSDEKTRNLWEEYLEDQNELLREFIDVSYTLSQIEDSIEKGELTPEVQQKKFTLENRKETLDSLLKPVKVAFSSLRSIIPVQISFSADLKQNQVAICSNSEIYKRIKYGTKLIITPQISAFETILLVDEFITLDSSLCPPISDWIQISIEYRNIFGDNLAELNRGFVRFTTDEPQP